jgi:phosphomevalonate kinase
MSAGHTQEGESLATRIEASAPGKVVLWGEYAVLAGAPALVMAVNRRAYCTVDRGTTGWRISTCGFKGDETTLSIDDLRALRTPPAASLIGHLIATRSAARWPLALDARLCTAAFHSHGAKLGLGSSAALTVACQAALARLINEPPSLDHALEAHRALQHGGSGLDVAAAFHGGLVRFEGGAAERVQVALPAHVFVWTGRSASTPDHLARFNAWRASGDLAALHALAAGARALFEQPDTAALARYADALRALDDAGQLGIWSEPHRVLANLAMAHHLVYKPCGAGGGDVGVAFAPPGVPLDGFRRDAQAGGFSILQLESADHGVQVST